MKNEILLVDKPEGMSSFGVVARVRRVLTEAENRARKKVAQDSGATYQKVKKVKVGHTGTLDPFATGLLILLVGKETKRANDFLKLDKEYIATLELGATSTTGDPEGEITQLWKRKNDELVSTTEESGVKTEQKVREIPNKQAVEKCVEKFVGENLQKVPEFSAVKINGQRAYKLARAGKKVEMPTRKVQIYKVDIIEYQWPVLKIRCEVSSGTYIRALAEDIGSDLGVGAYLTALRRTKVGEWKVEDAMRLDELMEKLK